MLQRRDQYKRSLIPQHSKDDVAEFVDNGAQCSHFFLGFTFLLVIRAEDGILRLTILTQAHRLQSQHIEAAPGEGRAAFGHTQIGSG